MGEEIILDRGDTRRDETLRGRTGAHARNRARGTASRSPARLVRRRARLRPRQLRNNNLTRWTRSSTPRNRHKPPRLTRPEFDHHDGPEEYYDDDDGYGYDDYDDDDVGYAPQPPQEQPSSGYSSIDDEKADLINKLNRLEKKGFAVNKKLNVYSQIDDIRAEVKRITYSIEIDQSIRFSRRMLIACTTGLSF